VLLSATSCGGLRDGESLSPPCALFSQAAIADPWRSPSVREALCPHNRSALPLLTWTPRERERAIAILRRDVEHPQKFVRAWALDSLATFAAANPVLLPLASRHLRAFERSGSKALASRARICRARLDFRGSRQEAT
jgi:hypothetical protein